MFKFLYSLQPSAGPRLGTARRGIDDPFVEPEIANMDLRMLADLPPEQLRDREGREGVGKPEAGRDPSLDSGAKRNGVKRSGFAHPFQARQAELGEAS